MTPASGHYCIDRVVEDLAGHDGLVIGLRLD